MADLWRIAPWYPTYDTPESVAGLTALLHRAYAPLGARGLNYTSVDQSVDVTRERIAAGDCVVAVVGDRVIGTIVAQHTKPGSSSAWYRRPDVASAHHFAVEPEYQGRGIGTGLLDWAGDWAATRGYAELALDTAEPATDLVAYYHRRGFRFIEHVQWQGKRYRTVILSRPAGQNPAAVSSPT